MAVTWNSSGWQFASVAGPALGGLIIALTGGATWVFLLGVRVLARRDRAVRLAPAFGGRADDRAGVARHRSWSGLRFVRRTEMILAAITLDLFAVLLGGAVALLPVFAKDILQIGPVGLGWLRAAPSVGAVADGPDAGPSAAAPAGGAGLALVGGRLRRGDDRLRALAEPLPLVRPAGDHGRPGHGQRGRPIDPGSGPHARVDARAGSAAVNSIFIGSSNELGGFESGITARYFGPVASVVGGGIGTILVVLAVGFAWPGVARLGLARRPGTAEKPGLDDATSRSWSTRRGRRLSSSLTTGPPFITKPTCLQDPDVGQRVALDRDQVGVAARARSCRRSPTRPSSSAASEVAERIARAGVRPYLTM